MTQEEARQLIGVEGDFSGEELEEAFRRRSQELESKIKRAPTPGLKEKYRRNLSQVEEAWEVLTDGENIVEADNLPTLRPVVVEESRLPGPTLTSPPPAWPETDKPIQVVKEGPAFWKTPSFRIGMFILTICLLCWGLAEVAIGLIGASGPKADQPWTNSMGMKFVPAGTEGVLFCIWDVRVKDYAVFEQENARDWPKPKFDQTENDPAVNVSWDDAHAFCDWLTKREQAEGKLGSSQKYRLPTDAEWSKAVGLNETSEGTSKSKGAQNQDLYPWGRQWPPPKGAGNFSGEEFRVRQSFNIVEGYNDGYVETSPVGSFSPNAYGLYDMGGNVWQWVEDYINENHDWRASRGGSWNDPAWPLSRRDGLGPDMRREYYGFRVVLVVTP